MSDFKTDRLTELGNLISEGRKLPDYGNSPIQVFLEALDELRLEVLKQRERIAKLEKVREAAVLILMAEDGDGPDRYPVYEGDEIKYLELALKESEVTDDTD